MKQKEKIIITVIIIVIINILLIAVCVIGIGMWFKFNPHQSRKNMAKTFLEQKYEGYTFTLTAIGNRSIVSDSVTMWFYPDNNSSILFEVNCFGESIQDAFMKELFEYELKEQFNSLSELYEFDILMAPAILTEGDYKEENNTQMHRNEFLNKYNSRLLVYAVINTSSIKNNSSNFMTLVDEFSKEVDIDKSISYDFYLVDNEEYPKLEEYFKSTPNVGSTMIEKYDIINEFGFAVNKGVWNADKTDIIKILENID